MASAPMDVYGIDFTSRPRTGKPITCLHCRLDGESLRARELEKHATFESFEEVLRRPGPWIAGIDFPFGQARRFIETIDWPISWADYVEYVGTLSRGDFCKELTSYREQRQPRDKEHRRRTDEMSGSVSPQKLYGVPVGLMFFEGAPRLLASGVTLPHHRRAGDPERLVVEAYPGVLARQLIGRRPYKSDARSRQTSARADARLEIVKAVQHEGAARFGFAVDACASLCDDPAGDALDALLCAVQAAWAWNRRDQGFGAPPDVDAQEGWIATPVEPTSA